MGQIAAAGAHYLQRIGHTDASCHEPLTSSLIASHCRPARQMLISGHAPGVDPPVADLRPAQRGPLHSAPPRLYARHHARLSPDGSEPRSGCLCTRVNRAFALTAPLVVHSERRASSTTTAVRARAPDRSASLHQEEGCALFGLEATLDGALYRNSVVRFSPRGASLPFHSFASGDMVLISRGEPDQDAIEGVVVTLAAGWLRVAISKDVAASVAGQGWRVDAYASAVAYERARAALDAFQIMPPPTHPTASLRRCAAVTCAHPTRRGGAQHIPDVGRNGRASAARRAMHHATYAK